jgi:hypothetical protein
MGLGLFVMLTSASAFAGTRMIFPRIVFQQGRWSGIAIVNPNSSGATVTLKAYNSDGTPFAGDGVTNPATGTVPAGGQYLKLANEVLTPSAAVTGSPTPIRLWLEVTSTTDGLTGFFLEGNDSITSLYGGDLGTFGTDLFLPAVQNSGSNITEVSLVNADVADANITVSFLRADGTEVASRSAVVPKAGALSGPLSSIPGFDIAYDEVAALRIRSDRPIVCYGVVLRPSDNTPTALSAEDSTVPAKTLYFPQLADGGGWSTGIGIVNLKFTDSTLVTLSAYKEDGTLFADPGMTNPVTQLIPKGGFFHTNVRSLFGFSGAALQVGWIKVEADTPSINGYVEYGTSTSHALVTAQLASSQLSMFSHQANASPYYTGLAVLNPGSLTANVEVFSINANGDIIGKTQHVLRPGAKESLVMQQWISASDGKTGGSVFVRTDRPVIATQLFGSALALANVPPQALTTGYSPRGDPGRISPTPQLAVVETGKTQQFQAPGVSGVEWWVNGIKEGDKNTVGTITSGGLYTAPAKAPAPRSLTIEARTTVGDRSGGSSIDVVQRETLTAGLTLVTSVAYMDNLNRFFVAEQQVISGAPSTGSAASTVNTNISEVTKSGSSTITTLFKPIPNDTIAKMLPFVDGGNSYLILAGHDSGKIYRLDVASKSLATIISGLGQPDSLALDPITGSLLVADAGTGQITIVPRPQILSASAPAGAARAIASPARVAAFSIFGVQGITVDACTGTLYATVSDGTLHEIQGSGNRTVATGLDNPRQLFPLYRDGFSCSDALTLAVVEATKVSLVYPKTQLPPAVLIGNLQNVLDITFFPKGNPFTTGGEASVGVAEQIAGVGNSRISDIPVGGLYESTPPVTIRPAGSGGTGPNEDPVGDTFGTDVSSQFGYGVPDIMSVTSSVEAGSSIITIKFKDAVTLGSLPASGPPADGLWAFLFIKTTAPATVQLPPGIDLSEYFPFGDPGLFIFDTYVQVFLGQASYVSFNQLSAGTLQVTAIGNTLTLSVPASALNLSGAKALVIVGNPVILTDVAPNNGLLLLAP